MAGINRNFKKPKAYITNKDFFEEIIKWQNTGAVLAKIPRPIIDKLQLIIDRYSMKSCFRFYRNLEDMKSEAMIKCLYGLYVFNYDRSQNPFAFFTECIKNSYFKTITGEKTLSKFKFSIVAEKIDETHKNDFREDSERTVEYSEEELNTLEEAAMNDMPVIEETPDEEKKVTRKTKIDSFYDTGFSTYTNIHINEDADVNDPKQSIILDDFEDVDIPNVNIEETNSSDVMADFLKDI